MRHYAQYNASGKLVSIGTGNGGVEITEAEYNTLLTEIREKAALVNQLYNGEITIDSIPAEWKEEIQRRVDERKAWSEVEDTETSEEAVVQEKAKAYDILVGAAQ